jgi:pilus assembly protein Flp/PilA
MFLLHREEGQGLVEYALIIFLIAIVLLVVVSLLGTTIGSIFSSIATGLGGT